MESRPGKLRSQSLLPAVGRKIIKMSEIKVDLPGYTQPELTTAAEFPLDDHEIVTGVIAFGEAKAYLRRAFSGLDTHVVHARFGKTQVTLTHCNCTRCARVFTAADDQDLSVMHCGGCVEEQELALLIGTKRFPHSSTEIPFDEAPYVVTMGQVACKKSAIHRQSRQPRGRQILEGEGRLVPSPRS
jgi:Protein of unknown function (DUF3179).